MFLLLFLLAGVQAEFCSQFSDCETCAGRHRVTFEVCHWCPTSNKCVSPSAGCAEGYRTLFDCPRLIEVPYNETFTRLIAAPIIAAAQGTQDQMNQCLGRIEGKLQLWRRFFITGEDGRDRPDGFVAVDFTRRAIIVSFSSVASGAKLLYNRFSVEFFTNRQAQFEGSNGLVNRLIYDSWFKTWYVLGMEKIIQQLLKAYPDFETWIFGHAIGGAKASMAAVAIGLKNITSSSKVRLLTFGATRVGDLSFVEMIETNIPERLRIINRHDMATRYPKEFDGEWTPPHHHRYEVWYPDGMGEGATYMVCLGAEDPQCSSRLTAWQLRAEDNDVYFERSMGQWVLSGCDGNDRVSKVVNPKFKLPTHPPLVYDLNALRTAKPYTTIAPPISLEPTQSTLRITLPPKHLMPVESGAEALTTEVTTTTTTTTTIATTTANVNIWPWWYTTQPWSSTTAAPTTKEWDEGKQTDDTVSKVFASPANPTNTTTVTSSFRDNFFRPYEKTKKFRSVATAAGATSVVERESSKLLPKTSPAKSRPWSYRVPKGPRRSPTREKAWYPKRRPTPTDENFLTMVDREADQVVGWDGPSSSTNEWESNRSGFQKSKRSTVTTKSDHIPQ